MEFASSCAVVDHFRMLLRVYTSVPNPGLNPSFTVLFFIAFLSKGPNNSRLFFLRCME